MTEARWDLGSCIDRLRDFTAERDWATFHRPKELATALSIEAAELQETMLWKTDSEIDEAVSTPEFANQVADEVADVGIYLMLLADKLGLDLRQSILNKIEANGRRYAADRHRGVAEKAPHPD